MGSSAATRVASPGGNAVVGQTGIMGAPGWSLLRKAQRCADSATAWPKVGQHVKRGGGPLRSATYAEVMSGPQGVNGERNPVAAVQSVDRALSVLEILAAHGEAGVTEVAAELGVHKSTAFRLVAEIGRAHV